MTYEPDKYVPPNTPVVLYYWLEDAVAASKESAS